MGRYQLSVPQGATPFQYNGRQYNPGDGLETDDACQALAFANAFHAQNPESGERDATPGAWDSIRAACPANPANAPGDAAPGPAVEADPAANGGDSAQNQGAPQLQDGVVDGGVRDAGAGDAGVGGDGGVPGQRPAPGDEPQRPPEGQVAPEISGDQPQQQTGGGDPVDLFSGALTIRETDLEVPNTLLPLAFVRSYRSGTPAYGAFGWNWDHNFNLYLRELDDGGVALWRVLHEDVFRFDGAKFEPPTAVFELLERVPGVAQAYELVSEGGTRTRFERPAGWVDGERIPAVRVEDRHGNALAFTYGAEDKLAEVRDDHDRFLRFTHDECGLLTAVEDHAGRRYLYEHDEETQQLVCVTTPPTADHPAGLVRRYEYADPWSAPKLRHNVVRVEDADGNVFLENTYDEDPASWSFARVVEQLYGDYLFQFRYTQLQSVPPDPVFVNVASVQTEMLNPDYGLETHTFNYRGDLLDRRFRLNKDRSFRVVAVQYEFDEQGNLTTTTRPDGSQEIITFDSANADPRMRGKLLRRELTAAAGFPAPSRIVWRGRYEPAFQLLVEEESETGATTAYRYDFDDNPGAATNTGKLVEVRQPDATLPDGSVQQATFRFEHNAAGQVTASVLPDGTRHEMEYGAAGDERGRLTRRIQDAGGLDVVDETSYDAFGFDSTTTDPRGHTTTKVVNALGLMERETLPAVGGATTGYVLHYNGDRRLSGVERPRGGYDDPTLAGRPITDAIDRDVFGHPVRCALGTNTGDPRAYESDYDFRGFPVRTRNPDGSRVDRVYDERGLPVEEAVVGSDGIRLTTRRGYDRTGRLTRVIAPGGATTSYAYDGFGRLRRVSLPNGSEVRFAWLEGDVLSSEEIVGDDGTGTTRRLQLKRYAYDERLRKTSETVESFVSDPATATALTTHVHHDPVDRVVRVVDHRGAQTVMQRDAIGRVVTRIDPVGNEERFEYDESSNLVRHERADREPDGSVSVHATDHAYDERNRLVSVAEADGASIDLEYDDRDLLTARTDYLGRVKRIGWNAYGDRVEERFEHGGTPAVHSWELDSMSRVLAYRDPDGEVSRYTLDGVGRIRRTEYPNGFTAERTYDGAGNVVEERLGSGARFTWTHDAANRIVALSNPAAPGAAALPNHTFAYDGLDRAVRAAVGGNQVTRRYDSRGRIVREEAMGATFACDYDDAAGTAVTRFPDGRAERHETDLNGTIVRIEEVAAGGLGSGNAGIATLTPSGPGHAGRAEYQGSLTVDATYDERKRLVELAAAGPGGPIHTTSYRYDTANTRRVEAFAGTDARTNYYEYDAKYRLAEARSGFAHAVAAADTQADHDAAVAAAQAASAAAPEHEEFSFDAADDRITHTRPDGSVGNYSYLPGHRVDSDGTDTFSYHADGAALSDGQVDYQVDALGRVVGISAGGTTLYRVDYDAFGRPRAIREGTSPERSFHYLGDRLQQESEGGNAVRQMTIGATGVPIAYHVAGTTQHPLFDGRLNLVALADSNGALLESYRYTPFGLPTILDPAGGVHATSQAGVEPIFGGQRYLPSASRYLARRRVMNPRHGMFVSPDPMGYAGSPSLYAYAAQNPVDLADPEGEFPFLAVLAVMAIGAAVGGGLNVARQHIAMAEDPERAARGFSWGELGISMGIGAVLAPVLVVAPELAIPLAAYGVYGGVSEMTEGHYATGAFDIVTALAPFGSKRVRVNTTGRGTYIGQARGMGPAAPMSVRTNRFTLMQNNMQFMIPRPWGRRIGLGYSRVSQTNPEGHTAVIVERPDGTWYFVEKNVTYDANGNMVASWRSSPTLLEYYSRRLNRTFEYDSIRVPRENAAEAMGYAENRILNPAEPFDPNCANCSHFAGDVIGQGGFRGMGNGRASGLWGDWTNFTGGREMAWLGPFWTPEVEEPGLSK